MNTTLSLDSAQTRSENYQEISEKILSLRGNGAILQQLDEWRASIFQLSLKRLLSELEGEEEHGLLYTLGRLDQFFAIQLKVVPVESILPTEESQLNGLGGLDELIRLQKQIQGLENVEERFILDGLLTESFEHRGAKYNLRKYTEAVERTTAKENKAETPSTLQVIKDRFLKLVHN